jgi:hypothetical protein
MRANPTRRCECAAKEQIVMSKQLVSVETINSICYETAHDIDFNEKKWIIPAFKSFVHYYAKEFMAGYEQPRVERLIDQWILVRQGKLNPVPRSLP